MEKGDVWLYKDSYYLVGDVNQLGGVCDDCSSRCDEGEFQGNILRLDDEKERGELIEKLSR